MKLLLKCVKIITDADDKQSQITQNMVAYAVVVYLTTKASFV